MAGWNPTGFLLVQKRKSMEICLANCPISEPIELMAQERRGSSAIQQQDCLWNSNHPKEMWIFAKEEYRSHSSQPAEALGSLHQIFFLIWFFPLENGISGNSPSMTRALSNATFCKRKSAIFKKSQINGRTNKQNDLKKKKTSAACSVHLWRHHRFVGTGNYASTTATFSQYCLFKESCSLAWLKL